ncbi:hypothetical protein LJC14_02445 [Treponema sp. OttesenSCG-928-L16]|nr:hypothetical protein [Treponema sp. OttesenSCG-928-L16]
MAPLKGSAGPGGKHKSVKAFAESSGADITVLEDGEHFFHTEEQLDFFRNWLDDKLA